MIEAFRVARGDPMGGFLIELMQDATTFNDKRVAMRVGYSAADVLAEYETGYNEAIALADALSPTLYINTGFLPAFGIQYDLEDFIIYVFYGHKKEHAAQITAFRERHP